MADGSTYLCRIVDANNNVHEGNQIVFAASTNQPLGLLNGAVIPTADPHVVGAIWANSAVLTVSAG